MMAYDHDPLLEIQGLQAIAKQHLAEKGHIDDWLLKRIADASAQLTPEQQDELLVRILGHKPDYLP
ncbi:MAG: hypothetical protein ACO3DD_10680 [Burkholderiaceae bacterium]